MGADFLLVCWHRVLGTFSEWPSGTWAYFRHICSGRFCWPPGHIFGRFCWHSGTLAFFVPILLAIGHIFGPILLAIGHLGIFSAHLFGPILLATGHLGTFSGWFCWPSGPGHIFGLFCCPSGTWAHFRADGPAGCVTLKNRIYFGLWPGCSQSAARRLVSTRGK